MNSNSSIMNLTIKDGVGPAISCVNANNTFVRQINIVNICKFIPPIRK